MKASQRRLAFGIAIGAAVLVGGYAYVRSLAPAAHPDHDHGILNIDSGGLLTVEGRDGRGRNLVGRPGKVLVVHLFSLKDPEATGELKGVFAFQQRTKGDAGIETVIVARDGAMKDLDALLAGAGVVPPFPATLYVDTSGETSTKFNVRNRTIETMFFNPDGKLSSQAHGRLDWDFGATGHVDRARTGNTIE
jgi:hypothetical protein